MGGDAGGILGMVGMGIGVGAAELITGGGATPLIAGALIGGAAGTGVGNFVDSSNASRAEKNLADQQNSELQASQEQAAALAAQQATTGSTFGFGDEPTTGFATGFGFGTAPSGAPNSGRQQITGMG